MGSAFGPVAEPAGTPSFVAFATLPPDNDLSEGNHAALEDPGQPVEPRLPPGEDVRPHESRARGPLSAGRLSLDATGGRTGVAGMEEKGGGDRRGAARHRGVFHGRAARSAGIRNNRPGDPRTGRVHPVAGVQAVRTDRGDGAAPPPPLGERPGRAGGRIACPGSQPPRPPRGPGGGSLPQGRAGPGPDPPGSGRRSSSGADPGSCPPTSTRSCACATATTSGWRSPPERWGNPCGSPSGWRRSTRTSANSSISPASSAGSSTSRASSRRPTQAESPPWGNLLRPSSDSRGRSA